MKTIEQIKAHITSRIETQRTKLEAIGVSEADSCVLRGRIAELKELLVALEGKALPSLNYASELDA